MMNSSWPPGLVRLTSIDGSTWNQKTSWQVGQWLRRLVGWQMMDDFAKKIRIKTTNCRRSKMAGHLASSTRSPAALCWWWAPPRTIKKEEDDEDGVWIANESRQPSPVIDINNIIPTPKSECFLPPRRKDTGQRVWSWPRQQSLL